MSQFSEYVNLVQTYSIFLHLSKQQQLSFLIIAN